MMNFCPVCEDYRNTEIKKLEKIYTVRNRKISITVSMEICMSCGQSITSDEKDQEILNVVHAGYRREIGLLSPDEIKEIRKKYRLSQKSFSILLGMSEATLNRYEQGAIQEQVHDNAIRACENPVYVLDLLQRKGDALSVWQKKQVENAIKQQSGICSDLRNPFDETKSFGMPREISEYTGYRLFDYNRFAYAIMWICNNYAGDVTRTVINKLIFYADFLNFKYSTVSLTGAAYRKLNYGPALADYDWLLSRMEAEGLLIRSEKDYPGGCSGFVYKTDPGSKKISVNFIPQELNVLQNVVNAFKNFTAKKISDLSHQEPAWCDTADKQYISYKKAATLSLDVKS